MRLSQVTVLAYDCDYTLEGRCMSDELKEAALVLVDIQNDFCPGGALAVREGDKIIETVNRIMPEFGFVAATQDWHPPNHISFKDRGGPWPPHCIKKTHGAELHEALDKSGIDVFIRKATEPDRDAYSGFEGSDELGRSMKEVLDGKGLRKLYVAGLATDYCVKATVLDALKNGYQVYAIADAMQAVDINRGDGRNALEEMKRAGAKIVTSAEVLREKGARSKSA